MGENGNFGKKKLKVFIIALVVDRGLNLERMILLIENTQTNRSKIDDRFELIGFLFRQIRINPILLPILYYQTSA
jgi:hypothetical protein